MARSTAATDSNEDEGVVNPDDPGRGRRVITEAAGEIARRSRNFAATFEAARLQKGAPLKAGKL